MSATAPEDKTTSDSRRYKGTVRFFDGARGWGFIRPDDSLPGITRDLFVHKTAVENSGMNTLTMGQRVSFVIGIHQGRPLARDLRTEIR